MVEKFAREGVYFSIHKWVDGGYFATIGELSEPIEAETAPIAICLAALKTVGVEVEGME